MIKQYLNIKLTTPLIWLLLAFLAALSLILGVAIANLNAMRETKNQTQRITDLRWQTIQLSQQALTLSSRNNRITLQVFLMTEHSEINLLLTERRQNTDQIDGLLRQIGALVNTEPERQLLDAIHQSRHSYVTSYQQALNLLLQESKLTEARQEMLTVALPRLHVYHEAWERFLTYQYNQVNHDGDLIEARYQHAQQRSLLLLMVGALLAIGSVLELVTQLQKAKALAAQQTRLLEQAQRASKSSNKTPTAGLLLGHNITTPHGKQQIR